MIEEDIVCRLRKRAEIRRGIAHRKSVQEGQPDRIADLLEEAAATIEGLLQNKVFIDRCERTPCSHTQSRPSLVGEIVMRPDLLPASIRRWQRYRIEYGFECSCPEGLIYLPPGTNAMALERYLNKHAKDYPPEEACPF